MCSVYSIDDREYDENIVVMMLDFCSDAAVLLDPKYIIL